MKRHGFTLLEMIIVAAIGAVLSLGMARLLKSLVVNVQQEQNRLGDEQQAEDALQPLVHLLQQTDPSSITLLSPEGVSWRGLSFSVKDHLYSLVQSGSTLLWQMDRASPKPWVQNCQGLHVAVDQLQDPRTLWIAFQVGKNHVLFMRRIALQQPS